MNFISLAATTSWLLKPFALLLSFIFDGVFYVVTMFTSNHSLAITIVLFTVIVRALMIPSYDEATALVPCYDTVTT